MQGPSAWPAPLDLVGLALVLLLLVLGLVRGLWWQVMRLIGVTLAVLAARWLGPPVAHGLGELWPELSSRARHGLSWGGIFLLALFAAALLGLLGQKLLEAMKLDLANRLAGALAGAATGLLVHVALVVVLCQLAPASFVAGHVAGTYSEKVYALLGVRWPVVLAADAAQEVDRVLESSPRHDPRAFPRRGDGVVR
jgi:membrane protein required for colicin V production